MLQKIFFKEQEGKWWFELVSSNHIKCLTAGSSTWIWLPKPCNVCPLWWLPLLLFTFLFVPLYLREERKNSCFISEIWCIVLGSSKERLDWGGVCDCCIYCLRHYCLLISWLTDFQKGKQGLRKEITFHRHNRPQKITLSYFKFD